MENLNLKADKLMSIADDMAAAACTLHSNMQSYDTFIKSRAKFIQVLKEELARKAVTIT